MAVLHADMPAASLLGQYFVVGYDSLDKAELRLLVILRGDWKHEDMIKLLA